MSCPKFFESIIKSLDICTFSLQAALHIWTKCGPSGLHLYRIVSLTGAVKNVSALFKNMLVLVIIMWWGFLIFAWRGFLGKWGKTHSTGSNKDLL